MHENLKADGNPAYCIKPKKKLTEINKQNQNKMSVFHMFLCSGSVTKWLQCEIYYTVPFYKLEHEIYYIISFYKCHLFQRYDTQKFINIKKYNSPTINV